MLPRIPQSIIDALTQKFKFKLKGTGPISFHLGMDFFRDKDGTFCIAPKKYIKKMIDSYLQIFGCKPTASYSSPLEPGDHPELDDSDLFDADGIQKYQSMIGSLAVGYHHWTS